MVGGRQKGLASKLCVHSTDHMTSESCVIFLRLGDFSIAW